MVGLAGQNLSDEGLKGKDSFPLKTYFWVRFKPTISLRGSRTMTWTHSAIFRLLFPHPRPQSFIYTHKPILSPFLWKISLKGCTTASQNLKYLIWAVSTLGRYLILMYNTEGIKYIEKKSWNKIGHIMTEGNLPLKHQDISIWKLLRQHMSY